MNTTLTNQVARHLQVAADAIARIEEWANCLFAVVRGMGARFVSKKIMTVEPKTITAYDYASGLAKMITDRTKSYNAKVWQKGDKVRVYVNMLNGKGVGYYGIENGLITFNAKSYVDTECEPLIDELIEKYDGFDIVSAPSPVSVSRKGKTMEIVGKILAASSFTPEQIKAITDHLQSSPIGLFEGNPDTPAWAWIAWAAASSGLGNNYLIPSLLTFDGEMTVTPWRVLTIKSKKKTSSLPSAFFVAGENGIEVEQSKPAREREDGEPIDSIDFDKLQTQLMIQGRSNAVLGKDFDFVFVRHDTTKFYNWDVATLAL